MPDWNFRKSKIYLISLNYVCAIHQKTITIFYLGAHGNGQRAPDYIKYVDELNTQ
jgi:hypothetical protein